MGAGRSKEATPQEFTSSSLPLLTGRVNVTKLGEYERKFRKKQSNYASRIAQRKLDVNEANKLANRARRLAEAAADANALIRETAIESKENRTSVISKLIRETAIASKENGTRAISELNRAHEAFGENSDYTDLNTITIGRAINDGKRIAQNAITIADRVLESIGTNSAESGETGAGASTEGGGSNRGGRRRTRRHRAVRK